MARSHRWIVLDAPTGRPVAFIAADVQGPEAPGTREALPPYSAGLVCVVDPDRHGQGIGPTGPTAVMSAPELGDVAEFRVAIEDANSASWKAVERLGFTHHETVTQDGKTVRDYRKGGPAANTESRPPDCPN
ncbi:GNAT family N-acetyltransferase [Nocardia transvalensis]|uniref:GNAT family N-acetyltransferase n=1 Tax=Nocardia transvalensis TaxID=37333 RepID=UPI00189474A8|nr:GNAT family protein [Nocardia transvalensis]MBF6333471.1 GNAT family N-acetyltransferase [Nocardia transvalensis]